MSVETKKFVLAVLLIVLGAAICIGQPWTFCGWHQWHVVEVIGEALLVAAVLAVTVDLYLKARLLREVARDVWAYIVGHPLPAELRDYLKQLANTSLLRRDWDIRYTLTKTSDPAKLKVQVDAEFSIINMTSTEQEYSQETTLEKHENPIVMLMACYAGDKKAAYERTLASEHKSNLAEPDDDNPGVLVVRGKKIWIKPNLDNPNLSYKVRLIREFEKGIQDSDFTSFGEPSIHVTVKVTAPSDVEVVISPEKAALASTLLAYPQRWEFNRLFPRGDHIRIRWYPKENAGAKA